MGDSLLDWLINRWLITYAESPWVIHLADPPCVDHSCLIHLV